MPDLIDILALSLFMVIAVALFVGGVLLGARLQRQARKGNDVTLGNLIKTPRSSVTTDPDDDGIGGYESPYEGYRL